MMKSGQLSQVVRTSLIVQSGGSSADMGRRKTTTILDTGKDAHASSPTVTGDLLSGTWPMAPYRMLLTSNARIFQRFMSRQSGVSCGAMAWSLTSASQSPTPPQRTLLVANAGHKSIVIGHWRTGRQWCSRMSQYSGFLGPMGWSGAGGRRVSGMIHNIPRNGSSLEEER